MVMQKSSPSCDTRTIINASKPSSSHVSFVTYSPVSEAKLLSLPLTLKIAYFLSRKVSTVSTDWLSLDFSFRELVFFVPSEKCSSSLEKNRGTLITLL